MTVGRGDDVVDESRFAPSEHGVHRDARRHTGPTCRSAPACYFPRPSLAAQARGTHGAVQALWSSSLRVMSDRLYGGNETDGMLPRRS